MEKTLMIFGIIIMFANIIDKVICSIFLLFSEKTRKIKNIHSYPIIIGSIFEVTIAFTTMIILTINYFIS